MIMPLIQGFGKQKLLSCNVFNYSYTVCYVRYSGEEKYAIFFAYELGTPGISEPLDLDRRCCVAVTQRVCHED